MSQPRNGLRPRRVLPSAAAAAACLATLALLGMRARTGQPFAWDARLHAALVDFSGWVDPRSDGLDDAVGYLAVYAADLMALAIVVAVSVALAISGRPREAAEVLVAVAVSVGLVFVLKGIFDRPPTAGYGKYELPSGHAMRSLLAAGLLAAAAWRTRARRAALAAAGLYAAAVGFAVVYEDWHLPSDVLGGWALAGAALAILILLTPKLLRVADAEAPETHLLPGRGRRRRARVPQ